MFCYSDPDADQLALTACPESELADAGRTAQRLERQAAARKILLAHRVGAAMFNHMLTPDPDHPIHPGIGNAAEKAAVGEISLQFGVSRTMAGRWAEVGQLLLALPTIRRHFLDGDYSFARVSIIAHTLAQITDDTHRSHAEHTAADLAQRPITDPMLREHLEALVIDLDPDHAAQTRDEFADRNHDVVITADAHGHASIDACVPAEHGLHLRKKITALITARTCRHDPRTPGQRRVAALADIHHTPGAHLTCHCHRDDCPKRSTTTTTETTPPQRQATASTITVVTGPAATHAHLRGHGPIDPTHAADLTALPHTTTIHLPDPHTSPAALTDRGRPPPGALVYTPSARLRAQILATDHHCRYPFCDTPADDCDLDHLIPFDHHNPLTGGWTVPHNIAPLCRPDHHRKHLHIWTPTMHPDRRITWRHHTTGQQLTTHPH